WWARRELNRAEEECCDAWVVWALPSAAKAYATALVDTLDFLANARQTLPVGASGLGQVNHLKRRVTMILRGSSQPSLTWVGLAALLGVGLLLPLLPVRAQTESIQRNLEAELKARRQQQAKQAEDKRRELERLLEEMEALRADFEKKRREFERRIHQIQ